MTLPNYPTTAAQPFHPRVELIEPRWFAGQAGAILGASWEPPCLCYPEEYLCWQFEFPGNPPALAAAAFLGDEPIGFSAVMPRRLRDMDRFFDGHLLSFVSVLPAYRGMQTATAVYRTLLLAIRDQGRPIVAFAEPDSVAEKVLIGTLQATGYRHHPLGHYRTHAYLPRGGAAAGGVSVEEVTDLAEFLAVVERCDGPGTLWNAPDLRQLEHYRADPRGRVLVLARSQEGEAIGAAMVVVSEAITRQGPERVATVDNLFLPDPSADALKAILDDAGRRLRGRMTSPVVTVPNLHGVNPGLLARPIGRRATPSIFNGHLFAPADEQAFDAWGTTLEIV